MDGCEIEGTVYGQAPDNSIHSFFDHIVPELNLNFSLCKQSFSLNACVVTLLNI